MNGENVVLYAYFISKEKNTTKIDSVKRTIIRLLARYAGTCL
jgi:hypothetical protein